MDDAKPFWTSRTLWANAVALVVSLAAGFGLDLGLDAEGQAAIVGGVMAVANIVLRVITRTSVSLT